jgi:Carboxypeptidase regulatory-like domain
MTNQHGQIVGYVTDVGTSPREPTGNPVVNANVYIHGPTAGEAAGTAVDDTERFAVTDAAGKFVFTNLADGRYQLACDAFMARSHTIRVDVKNGSAPQQEFTCKLGLRLTASRKADDGKRAPCEDVTAGTPVTLLAEYNEAAYGSKDTIVEWTADQGRLVECDSRNERLLTTEGALGRINVSVTLSEVGSPRVTAAAWFNVLAVPPQPISGQIAVMLQRSAVPPTLDLGLWAAIRNHAKAVSFGGLGAKPGSGNRPGNGYQGFIDRVLCGDGTGISAEGLPKSCAPAPDLGRLTDHWKKHRPIHGMAAYELLKTATEVFLLWNCGVAIRPTDALGNPIASDDDEFARSGLNVSDITGKLTQYLGTGRLPYIQRIVETAFPDEMAADSVFCTGLTPRVDCPCLIELIWSYWHEEGMLVQTLNAISRRFQNVRGPGDRDPLAHLEIDPLRPLNNLLWGYVQDELNRLTVKRRAYEYDHHYGLAIYGKATPTLRPVDSRSKFLEGFHNLLHRCYVFYKEDNDTTVIADGFPLLNALKEVHLLLAQGAHNQFGDLPWTARVEMLTQQWLLARPEIREFLQSRPMVPYTEAWMPQVDTMKTLQGWSDVTVTHFRDLGLYGEQILLTIRYGDWIDVNDENSAKNWARYWRPEIQGYLHAYRAVTGVDLTNPDTVDFTVPAAHLQRRLAMQRAR